MLIKNESFFTSAGCMDGRVQSPILAFGQNKFNAEFGDTLTEAGLVGILAKKNPDPSIVSLLKEKLTISVELHHSKGIIVHGHEKCAGNPVDNQTQKKDIIAAAKLITKIIENKIPVVPVFVYLSNSGTKWVTEELKT